MKKLQNVLNFPCTADLLIADFNSCAISLFLAFGISFVYTRKEIGVIQIRFLSFQLTNVTRSLCSFIFNTFLFLDPLPPTVCVFTKGHAALVILRATSVPLAFLFRKVFMLLSTVVFRKVIAVVSWWFDSNS